MNEPTMTFKIYEDKEEEMKKVMTAVYDALKQKGYNPVNQIVGYILSEDPTYITTYNNARGLIRRIFPACPLGLSPPERQRFCFTKPSPNGEKGSLRRGEGHG